MCSTVCIHVNYSAKTGCMNHLLAPTHQSYQSKHLFITHREEHPQEVHDDGLQPHGDDEDRHEDGARDQAAEEVVFVVDPT